MGIYRYVSAAALAALAVGLLLGGAQLDAPDVGEPDESTLHVSTGVDTGTSPNSYGLLREWQNAYRGRGSHSYDFDGDGRQETEQCGNCHMDDDTGIRTKHSPPLHPLAIEGRSGAGFRGDWFHDDGEHRGPNTRLADQASGIRPTTNCGDCHTPSTPDRLGTVAANATNDPHSVHREVSTREGCIRCHALENVTFSGAVGFRQGNATRTSYGLANPINMTRVWDGAFLSTEREANYTYYSGAGGLTRSGTVTLEARDGFETYAAGPGTPAGWEPVVTTGLSREEVTTTRAAEGAQSYRLRTNVGTFNRIHRRPVDQPYASPRTQEVVLSLLSAGTPSSPSPRVTLHLYEGTSRIVRVGMYYGDLRYHDGSGWRLISTAPDLNQWVTLRVHDINPVTNRFSLTWNTATASGTRRGLRMENPANAGWDSTVLAVNSNSGGLRADGYFDDLRIQRTGGTGWAVYGSAEAPGVTQFGCGDCHDQFHARQGYAQTGGRGLEFAFNDSAGSRKGPYTPVRDNQSYGLAVDGTLFTCGDCHPLDVHAVHSNGRTNSRASYAAVTNPADQSIIDEAVLGAELCDQCHSVNIDGRNTVHYSFGTIRERGLAGSPTTSHNRLPDLDSTLFNTGSRNEDCGFCHDIR